MRDEIGSEYWRSTHGQAVTHGQAGLPLWLRNKGDIRFYMSGRTALYAVIEDIVEERPCRTAYLPDYCCHTMIEPFLMHGIQVAFYPVTAGKGLRSLVDKGHPCDILLTADYFGYQGDRCILPDAVHIHDVTHSLLSKPAYHEPDYTYASFRKWGPVAGAGFACKHAGTFTGKGDMPECIPYMELRKKGYKIKEQYMKRETDDKTLFLEVFHEAELLLEKDFAGYGADSESLCAAALLQDGAGQRRENAKWLTAHLAESQIARPIFPSVQAQDVPLFVPVLIKGGMRSQLKQYLIENRVYAPVHWPLCHTAHTMTREIYENELSLICDQRYCVQDMERQLGLVLDFETTLGDKVNIQWQR